MSAPPRNALWPSPPQERLLKAALLDGAGARDAFRDWRHGLDPAGDWDWPTLRLLPLVCRNLQRLGLDDPLMGRIRGVYRRFWCENQGLFFAMTPILERLHAAGVRVLLLKGAALVLGYYRNHALRPMADFDLAVPLTQLPHALAVLTAAGWTWPGGPSPDDRRYFHALPCVQGRLQLDLHYHLLRECLSPEADQWFWTQTEPLAVQGLPLLQLAPTALLLHTIIHGVRSNPEAPIRWVPDAVTILRARGADIDWGRLLDFAQSQRLSRRLALGLDYLVRQFDVGPPAAAAARLARCRPGLLEGIANTVTLGERERLFARPLGKQWVIFAEYCALCRDPDPLRFLWAFSHYLRYRWQVRGRLALLAALGSGLLRRLARR